MKKYFLILFGLIFFFACSKDDVTPEDDPDDIPTETEEEDEIVCPDGYTPVFTDFAGGIVESGEYLAAYPGSWWSFSNDDYLTCETGIHELLETTEHNYETCEVSVNRTSFIAPIIIGNYTRNSGGDTARVYGDSILVKAGDYQTRVYKQIDLDIGDTWDEAGGYFWMDESGAEWYTYEPERKTIAFHDSLVIPSGEMFYDVVEIAQSHIYSGKPGDWTDGYYHLFYAKEIGLIWELDSLHDIRDRYLVDYHIAPH